MKILNKATEAAHQAKLKANANFQRYSQFPVHDAEFWEEVFKAAKTLKSASKVLREIQIIENEPCIDNERVWRNVCTAKSLASLTLKKLMSH